MAVNIYNPGQDVSFKYLITANVTYSTPVGVAIEVLLTKNEFRVVCVKSSTQNWIIKYDTIVWHVFPVFHFVIPQKPPTHPPTFPPHPYPPSPQPSDTVYSWSFVPPSSLPPPPTPPYLYVGR